MTAVLECRLPAMLGHELRNPLAGAMTNVAVAAELTDADDPRAAMLRLAQQDLARVAKLLDRCLDFADLGRVARHRQDLVEVARTVAARHGGLVHVDTNLPSLPVEIDRSLFERAIENLVENALSSGAGEVRISVCRAQRLARLEVRDDGPGVRQDLRDRIFEPFVSGRGSRGLGLPFVREVVHAHGGFVHLLEDAGGAAFRIEIPT